MSIVLKIRLKRVLLLLISLVFVLMVFALYNSAVINYFYPLKYSEQVYKYSSQYKLDPYLVFAIIKAESGFDPFAKSHKNARGLMQLTEKTGGWGAETLKIREYSCEKLFVPEININIGCWYVSRLMKEFNNDLDLVIAAYNGGSGNVKEWLSDRQLSSTGKNLDRIPFKETDSYLKKVKRFYSMYKKVYKDRY